jgi:molybdate transport system ATP-binding protein
MADIFLTIEGVTVRMGGATLLDNLDWTIRRGEQWAVVGPSGGGKTVLAHTLLGRHFASGQISCERLRITIVEQQHRFRGLPGATDLYYQQRFNSGDAGGTITVAGELAASGMEPGMMEGRSEDWLDDLHVRPLLSKPLIQLSNGENKRVQLAIALLESPDMLILDNPFLGLDVDGRAVLHTIIDRMAATGMQILLITGEREIPPCITHIGRLEKGKWTSLATRTEYAPAAEPRNLVGLDTAILAKLQAADRTTADKENAEGLTDRSVVIAMHGVNIRYGDVRILHDINWQVHRGERWSVSGPNGAGKSTLLSLISADNPQAYANDIRLFGRRRGSGESIWDIKRKIGFVSPELHLYFDSGANCFEVIASGLFDSVGLFRRLTPEQEEIVMWWMRLLSLDALSRKRLAQLPAGKQRMVLLARALIKDPPMLILDEPCQGLDDGQTACFRELITVLCETFEKTLVYVSHYPQDLPRCIDKFLRLEKGVRVE